MCVLCFQYYLLLYYNLLHLLFSLLVVLKSYSDVFSIPGKAVFFGTSGRSSERDVIWIGPRQKTDWGMCVKISRQENETEDNDCLACPPTHYWNAEKLQYTHIATTLYKLCMKLELYFLKQHLTVVAACCFYVGVHVCATEKIWAKIRVCVR